MSKHTFRFFRRHLWNYRLVFGGMTIAMILAVVTEMIVPIYYKDIFDLFLEDTGMDRAEIVAQMMNLVWIIAGLHITSMLLWRCCEFGSNYLHANAMKSIADEGFEHLTRHSYRFFSDHFAGSLVRKLGRLMWAFNKFTDQIYWKFISLFVMITTIIGVLMWYSTLLGSVVLAWCVIFTVVNVYLARWKYPLEVQVTRRDSMLSGNIADVATNSTNVKLFTAHQYEQKRFEDNTGLWSKARKRSWDVGSFINWGQAMFMIVLELAVIVLTIRLWGQDLVTVGFLFLVQAYMFRLIRRIWDLRHVIQATFDSFADAEEMMTILHTPHEIVNKSNAKALEVHNAQIEFKKVDFGYMKGQEVLKNFNLTIQPGEKIALVGHSGEGKSTITKLIMRFFDLQKGEILFDGQNIADVTLRSLRENISLVPQDPVLFHRSLLDNIRYGKRGASEKEVIKAAKLANCDEFIRQTEKGYGTFVGERGIKLSGGERQRVAIARAILENAPLVILDEATSSLDSHSERLIQQALHRLLKGKTAIIIAHRLSTIMEADRILVISKGKVIEQGSHRQLLKKKNGAYRHLWDIQAGSFIGE